MNFWLPLLLLFSFPTHGNLPPEAQNYLQQIPGQKLSLEYVVAQAIKNAEVYELLGLQYAEADLQFEKVQIAEEWYFAGGGKITDNEYLTTSPFQPVRTQGWNWNLGLRKHFSTGTDVALGWNHSFSDLQFNLPPGFGGGFLDNFRTTESFVQIDQSLLKDFFGYSYGKKLAAAKQQTAGLKSQVKAEFERQTQEFINAFYNAWLAQQRVMSVQEQVRRVERLLQVTKLKRDRGVVESPELIQVEALAAARRAELGIAKSELQGIWEALVLNLKLPESFLQVDPQAVPTILDNPMATASRLCFHGQPQLTAAIDGLQKQQEAAQAQLDGVSNDALPDLKLRTRYSGNGIDSRSSVTFDQIWQGQGPAWEVGLNLEWPLSNLQNRVERKASFINLMRANSQLQSAKDNLKTSWLSQCRQLKLEIVNEAQFYQTVTKQAQRVKAEERRFNLGRISVDQLVTAEDDLGTWEFRYQTQAVKVRNIAWQVQQLAGEMYSKLAPLIEGQFNAKSD